MAVLSIAIMEPTYRTEDGQLTAREEQVLQHVSFGKTNAEIATELHVSVHAIKFHLQRVFRKLGVANRTEAAVRYADRTRFNG